MDLARPLTGRQAGSGAKPGHPQFSQAGPVDVVFGYRSEGSSCFAPRKKYWTSSGSASAASRWRGGTVTDDLFALLPLPALLQRGRSADLTTHTLVLREHAESKGEPDHSVAASLAARSKAEVS